MPTLTARSLTTVLLALLLALAACAPDVDVATPDGEDDPENGGEGEGGEEADGGGGASLDFVWFTDGPDLEVIEELVGQFEEEEGIDVEFLVLPFADLNERLQAQVAGGEAPDVVRLADTSPFRRDLLDITPYLEDAEAFRSAFLEPALQPVTGPDGELYGIPHDFTMNGPLVNVDAFDAAGIDVPGADDEPWTWEELIANARAAQEAVDAPYAVAYDRSAHRFGGMLSQFGGRYFEPDGDVAFSGDGTEEALSTFVGLHDDGLAPLDVWLGSGGNYAAATDFFVSQQAPVYFAGNWMVAQFAQDISDFEWAAMPNPCAAECGGYPGGKFVTAFDGTDQPEAAAALISFLGSREAMETYALRAQFLPTRNDLIEEGIAYEDRAEDMAVFLADIPRLPDATYNDNYNRVFGPVAGIAADQISRALAGEADVDEVIQAVQEEGQVIVEEAR
ncbi:ABC transporter substrate-binding protein [soil metagenome]